MRVKAKDGRRMQGRIATPGTVPKNAQPTNRPARHRRPGVFNSQPKGCDNAS